MGDTDTTWLCTRAEVPVGVAVTAEGAVAQGLPPEQQVATVDTEESEQLAELLHRPRPAAMSAILDAQSTPPAATTADLPRRPTTGSRLVRCWGCGQLADLRVYRAGQRVTLLTPSPTGRAGSPVQRDPRQWSVLRAELDALFAGQPS